MSEATVNQLYKECLAVLTYEPLSAEQLETASESEKLEDTRRKKAEMGKEVLEGVEASDLTASEKQEVYQRLAKAGVEIEIGLAKDPSTLLRSNDKITNFMAAYMNKYASDYLEAVTQAAATEAGNVKLPGSFKGKDIGGFEASIPGVKPKDMKKLEEAYVQVSRKIVEASETNLSQLSPEARGFMKAALQPTQGNPNARNMATANILLLRGTSPAIFLKSSKWILKPETCVQGEILKNASIITLSYGNSINIPHTQKLSSKKPQAPFADQLRTEQALEDTQKVYAALANGSKAVDVCLSHRAVRGEMEKEIAQLETRLQSLNDASGARKFKAWFQGGIAKLRVEAALELGEAKMKLLAHVEPVGYEAMIRRERAMMPKAELEIDSLGSQLPQLRPSTNQYVSVRKALGGNISTGERPAPQIAQRAEIVDSELKLRSKVKAQGERVTVLDSLREKSDFSFVQKPAKRNAVVFHRY